MGFFGAFFAAIFDPSTENRNNLKGVAGEAQTNLGLHLFLPAEYSILNNVIIRTPKGSTQIDHVVVSPFGIFVIESKNIKGSIYGAPGQSKWTVFLGSKKYQIHNPLLQNLAHIKALVAATGLSEACFHSLVFFWADYCTFKTEMPENVLREGLTSYIKSKQVPLIETARVPGIIEAIESVRLPDTAETEREHVSQLRARFHTRHIPGDSCPRCRDGQLVQRIARGTGKSFLGCSNFPHCRHVEAV